MELLFDTLLKKDIFGGIMVIDEERGNEPLFAYRPFSMNGEATQSSQVGSLLKLTFFVIDGQQRLQSYYMGLKGSFNGMRLYFDLFSSPTSYEFKFARNESDLHRVADVDEDSEREIKQRKWYPVPELFSRLIHFQDYGPVCKEIGKGHTGTLIDAQRAAIDDNVRTFFRNVFELERVGVAHVVNTSDDRKANTSRIVELFRRLNDGGTRLSAYDLFASKMKGFNWKMEAFLDRLVAPNSAYAKIGLTQDTLIKLVFLLQGDAQKDIQDVTEADADFAVNNSDRIERALRNTVDFLDKSKLANYFGSGNRTFIPILFIGHHLFYRQAPADYFRNYDTGNPDAKPLRDWVFHSMLNGTFKGRGTGWIAHKTGVRMILELMETAKGKDFPIGKLLGLYRTKLHVFTTDYVTADLSELDHDFVLFMLSDRERAIGPQDLDHIHPRSRLEARGVESYKINSLANYELLDFATNRGPKNGALFDQWLNNPAKVPDKDEYMKRQLIPHDPDLHKIERFDDFLAERTRMIREKLQAAF